MTRYQKDVWQKESGEKCVATKSSNWGQKVVYFQYNFINICFYQIPFLYLAWVEERDIIQRIMNGVPYM